MVEANTDLPLSFACGIIEELQHQFLERFANFHAKADELRLFQNPFDVDAAACPDSLQLEVIELQANHLLRDKFKEGLVQFYQFLPKQNYQNLRHFAAGLLSMFGTTYLCEKTFSSMKYVKNSYRTNMSDETLRALLMLGTSNLKPNFFTILSSKSQFHHSH